MHRGGVIVNIGSGCNKVPFPGLVAYTASKGGIEMLTKVAAVELAPHRHPRQLCRARRGRGRTDETGNRRLRRHVGRGDAARPRRHARRHRQDSALPGERRQRVHHRPDHLGRRRALHAAALAEDEVTRGTACSFRLHETDTRRRTAEIRAGLHHGSAARSARGDRPNRIAGIARPAASANGTPSPPPASVRAARRNGPIPPACPATNGRRTPTGTCPTIRERRAGPPPLVDGFERQASARSRRSAREFVRAKAEVRGRAPKDMIRTFCL